MKRLLLALALALSSFGAFANDADIERIKLTAPPPPVTNEYQLVSVVEGGVTNTFKCSQVFRPDYRAMVKAHGKRISIEVDGCFIRWHFADGYVYERKFPRAVADSRRMFPRLHASKEEIRAVLSSNGEDKEVK